MESIADRSRLHNWEIQPHRHASLVQLLLIEAGQARVQIDGRVLELPAPALVWVPMLVVTASPSRRRPRAMSSRWTRPACASCSARRAVCGRACPARAPPRCRPILRRARRCSPSRGPCATTMPAARPGAPRCWTAPC
ncbi:AraC family ligand binding domain-containing protein [Roseateles saccharophilus]|uniref:AraC family ligand binding domain-containing protein n=1 Tax=Roseateles saccharophilus TaxID=304 RepID=UPI0038F726DD